MRLDHIYCQDNVLGLREHVPDESIDLTVTSPPYDRLRTYQGYTFDLVDVVNELYRVTKKGGVIVWVVGDQVIKGSETGTSFRHALTFLKRGFRLHDTMIYQKKGRPFRDPTRYAQQFEYMFVFAKGKPKAINLIKDRPNKQAGRLSGASFRRKNGEMCRNKKRNITPPFGVRSNIWEYDAGYLKTTLDREAFVHPAMFPESLVRDHILSWSDEGDVVLDPFMGSGTTAKVARILHRHYIGFEVSSEYVELANRRVRSTLFRSS